jgi:hypothetical protein
MPVVRRLSRKSTCVRTCGLRRCFFSPQPPLLRVLCAVCLCARACVRLCPTLVPPACLNLSLERLNLFAVPLSCSAHPGYGAAARACHRSAAGPAWAAGSRHETNGAIAVLILVLCREWLTRPHDSHCAHRGHFRTERPESLGASCSRFLCAEMIPKSHGAAAGQPRTRLQRPGSFTLRGSFASPGILFRCERR